MMRLLLLTAALLQAALQLSVVSGFSLPSSPLHLNSAAHKTSAFLEKNNALITLYSTNDDTEQEASSSSSTLTLEEKMKSWEASEEELKAATLGGVIPSPSSSENRSDAFDIGLYIAFPIMVIGCLIFAFFPLIVSNIDVTSVGPPPTS